MIHVPIREKAIGTLAKAGAVVAAINDRWLDFFQRLGASYGTWYAVPYAAANFSWTVESGDQVTFAYTQMGQRVEVALTLRTTASGAVANGTVTIPAGMVAARDVSVLVEVNDNGTTMAGRAKVAAGGTVITITRVDGAAFTDLRAVEGQIAFEVRGEA